MFIDVRRLLDEVTNEDLNSQKRAAALTILIGLAEYNPEGVAREIRKEGLKASHGILMNEITGHKIIFIIERKKQGV